MLSLSLVGQFGALLHTDTLVNFSVNWKFEYLERFKSKVYFKFIFVILQFWMSISNVFVKR